MARTKLTARSRPPDEPTNGWHQPPSTPAPGRKVCWSTDPAKVGWWMYKESRYCPDNTRGRKADAYRIAKAGGAVAPKRTRAPATRVNPYEGIKRGGLKVAKVLHDSDISDVSSDEDIPQRRKSVATDTRRCFDKNGNEVPKTGKRCPNGSRVERKAGVFKGRAPKKEEPRPKYTPGRSRAVSVHRSELAPPPKRVDPVKLENAYTVQGGKVQIPPKSEERILPKIRRSKNVVSIVKKPNEDISKKQAASIAQQYDLTQRQAEWAGILIRDQKFDELDKFLTRVLKEPPKKKK